MAPLYRHCGILLFLALSPFVAGEELPFKSYTTADGLPTNQINAILQDSRGFLWLATSDGLSRFDGYQFTNYGIEQGLPHRIVEGLLETRGGELWLATAAGVVRFNPAAGDGAGSRFVRYGPNGENRPLPTNTLVQDRAGTIWCGTQDGVYRLEPDRAGVVLRRVEIGLPAGDARGRDVEALFEDSRGALWVAAGPVVYRRIADGRVERYPIENPEGAYNRVHAFAEDRAGRIWAGSQLGLYRFVAEPSPGRALVEQQYFPRRTDSLLLASDGTLWVGQNFLREVELSDSSDVLAIRTYGESEGLVEHGTETLTEDRDGNFWVATNGGGAIKITRKGLVKFGRAEGFKEIWSIFEDRAGHVVVVPGERSLKWFDGAVFQTVEIGALKNIKGGLGWGVRQTAFQDHSGEWWIPTSEGLFRFAAMPIARLARARPKAFYTTRDGLGGNDIFRLFEDRRGDVWISTISNGPSGLARWERETGRIRQYSEADGLPAGIPAGTATAFAEDGEGNLWMGFYSGGLARYRDGRFRWFGAADGASAGGAHALYCDHAQRLWLATSYGLSRIVDPGSEKPRFVSLSRAQGLSSAAVEAISEDGWGRLFVCTRRGVDRLNLDDGSASHYTGAEAGLALADPCCALRDRHGNVWIGSGHNGLVRFTPRLEPAAAPPPVLLTGVRISGVAHPISEFGESEIGPLTLAPGRNQLQIDFVGLGLMDSNELRYEYLLEGGGQGWSVPGTQRTVHLAGLRPGKYRFLARAVTAAEIRSPRPASFAFTILPPVWQRWWFETIAVMALLAAAYFAYRYRVGRLLELERVRTRLAIDLHDDIGSGLAEIVILTEVAKAQSASAAGEVLDRVAGRARALRESMSDIVWTVDPRLDTMADLLRRIRQAAFALLAGEGMEVDFSAPADDGLETIELAPDRRRHLLLLLKEALTNIARHARASRVLVEIHLKDGELRVAVQDNGCGFDPERASSGHGMGSMRKRAAELKARLNITSAVGSGTCIELLAPLKKS